MNYTSIAAALGLVTALSGSLAAQDQRNEQFYYPGSFNWQFLNRYPEGGRLFNAFDYGHAVLYEKLYTRPRDLVAELEIRQFTYLTTDLLVRPPRFAVAEETIEPAYAKLAWRAKLMFDWAHLLHRQIYDIYADPRLTRSEQDRRIERVTDYYLSNRRLAFSVKPKSMSLMDDQYYSRVFRHGYPKFNGLIWAYHWLQVGLYEPLIEGHSVSERKAGVQATIARFWTMVEDAPARFPKVMPMTPVVAPLFTAAHPRAAIIFDNLHMTHDIISDILAADTVPSERKRAVIYGALDEMQDTTRNVMPRQEWQNMGEMMGGIGIMGGPATGILPDPPTVGASAREMTVMAGMEHGELDHVTGAVPGGEAADISHKHDMKANPDSVAAASHPMMDMGHDMSGMGMSHMIGDSTMQAQTQLMMDLHRRMMANPVIYERVMADTGMTRIMREMMMNHAEPTPAGPQTRKPAPKKPRPAVADSMPGMDHSRMPGMPMPPDSTRN